LTPNSCRAVTGSEQGTIRFTVQPHLAGIMGTMLLAEDSQGNMEQGADKKLTE